MMSEKSEKILQINGVKVGYTDKKITSYGGFSLVAKFWDCREIGMGKDGVLMVCISRQP